MNAPDGGFVTRVCKAAERLPVGVIHAFCTVLEGLPDDASHATRAASVAGVGPASARGALAKLVERWNIDAPTLTPSAVAFVLRAADATGAHHRKQRPEIVWSGPKTAEVPVRRTDQALLQLIEGATESLLVVTFVAYKVPAIRAALVAAVERGVSVQLVVESSEHSAGKTSFDAVDALGDDLTSRVACYVWPLEKRKKDAQGNTGSLHVKCAVADDSQLLVSSANLTEHALELNMELGVLIRGGPVPARVGAHFRTLVERGDLYRCNR